MPTRPLDPVLYAEVKRKIYNAHPKHSAYRSGMVVREYKRRGGRYAGGEKTRSKTGLARWFNEKWVDACEWQHGRIKPCGRRTTKSRSREYPYCRPMVRVSSTTPKTIDELTPAEIRRNCRKKHKGKDRVRAFVEDHRHQVCIFQSSIPSKKWMVVFYDRHDRPKRRVHFGSWTKADYTTGASVADRERYFRRHKGRGRWGENHIHSSGFWSRWLLWESKKMTTALRRLATRFRDTHHIRMCSLGTRRSRPCRSKGCVDDG